MSPFLWSHTTYHLPSYLVSAGSRISALSKDRSRAHLGAVFHGLLAVKCALLACEALADNPRSFIHPDCRCRPHGPPRYAGHVRPAQESGCSSEKSCSCSSGDYGRHVLHSHQVAQDWVSVVLFSLPLLVSTPPVAILALCVSLPSRLAPSESCSTSDAHLNPSSAGLPASSCRKKLTVAFKLFPPTPDRLLLRERESERVPVSLPSPLFTLLARSPLLLSDRCYCCRCGIFQ